MPDQNIKIDVELKALDKLPQYKAGFDSLRDAVNNLNKEIVSSTDKLSKMNAQNKENLTWGEKLKKGVTDLITTYKTLKEFLEDASLATGGWGAALAGAFTLITTYGPAVLDFLNKIFQSDKTREASQALKDYKNVMTGYIENISGGLAKVGMLVNKAGNEGLHHKTRIDALQELINLSPKHLDNLTLENLKTKEGKKLVDDYTKSLKQRGLEESALAERSKYVKQMEELDPEYRAARKERDAYWSGQKKNEIIKKKGSSLYGNMQSNIEINPQKEAEEKYNLVKKRYAEFLRQISRLDYIVAKNAVQNYTSPIPQKIEEPKDTPKTSVKFTSYNKPDHPTGPSEEQIRKESADRMALLTLQGYAREIEETNQHFEQLKKEHKGNNATLEQLEREHQATLDSIIQKFQDEGLAKLAVYGEELKKTSTDTHAEALMQITEEYRKKATEVDEIKKQNQALAQKAEEEIFNLSNAKLNITSQSQIAQIDVKIKALEQKRTEAQTVVDQATLIAKQLSDKRDTDSNVENKKFADERKQAMFEKDKGNFEDNVSTAQANGNWQQEFAAKQQLLNLEKQQALDAAKDQNEKKAQIERDYKQKQDALDQARLDTQVANQKKYVKGLETLSQAVTAIFGKNTIAARLAFKAHQAAAAANVIIDTRQAIMGIWKANAGLPLVGTAKAIVETAIVAATGASNLATILKQKPGFARGGQYTSDGRGALLPGYSRTDNTNAYLRSGEAVVVSEAMRNPWARNLVSAINVTHGGRDFSIPNPGRGYAVGGIFTDGGNANRYYSAPVNDQKDLANTLAYQMLNNFPPIYVDVKDVNNQQNILAQTVNRVTL